MKKAGGFTLIEIVIVVAIIGLLMVVLVPSITSSWNTNNMKAARLQAERIAKSVKVGILAGDVKTSTTAKAYNTTNKEKVNINPTKNCINYIAGIETLYEDPDNNEDLEDPTSKEEEQQKKLFQIAYENTNEQDDEGNDIYKIVIYNAKGTEKMYYEQ